MIFYLKETDSWLKEGCKPPPMLKLNALYALPSTKTNTHFFGFIRWLQIEIWGCFKLTGIAVVHLEKTASFINAFPCLSDVCV